MVVVAERKEPSNIRLRKNTKVSNGAEGSKFVSVRAAGQDGRPCSKKNNVFEATDGRVHTQGKFFFFSQTYV